MPTYIGENKIIDRYLGDKFLEAAYIGDRKVYDPYTEITGYLPMIYKSRAAVALKNYRIHGTAEGAGVETENLVSEIRTANGWRPGYLNKNDGAYNSSQYRGEWLSPFIDVESMTSVSIVYKSLPSDASPSQTIYFFDTNDEYLSSQTSFNNRGGAFNDFPSGTAKICYAFRTYCNTEQDLIQAKMWTMLIKGSTPPETYIPHGYKLPLTVESGAQSQDIPIYIGSTKLGAEEYVDYWEQKMYKRTENLLDMADLINAPPGVLSNTDLDAVLVLTLRPNTTYTLLSTGFGSSNASEDSDIYCSVYFNGPNRGHCVFAGRPLSSTTGNDGVIKIGFMKSRTNAQQYINGSAYVCLLEGDHTSAQDDIIPYLQPTDPPVPLPPIPTYKGENTLSSTETLGEVTVKGRIRELNYKRLSYIKSSDGSAYINTDITGLNAATDYIEAEMSLGALNYVEDGVVLFGCATANDGHWKLFGAACNGYEQDTNVRNNHFYSYVNYSTGGSGTIKRMRVVTNGDFSSKLLFSVKTPQSTITNLETGTVYTPSVFDPNWDAASLQPIDFVQTASFTVFAGQYYRSAENIVYYKSHRNVSCYGARIYRNDVLIHNLVPVEREDGELGLLDTITNKFYTNAGTGTFEKGEYI